MDLRAVVLSGGCLTSLRSIFKSYDNPPKNKQAAHLALLFQVWAWIVTLPLFTDFNFSLCKLLVSLFTKCFLFPC